MTGVRISRRAEKDLRHLPVSERERIRTALRKLGDGTATDVVPLVGRQPWRRLRVGEYRVLFTPIDEEDGYYVERVVSRQALLEAVDRLAR